jgi:hypothetical protein
MFFIAPMKSGNPEPCDGFEVIHIVVVRLNQLHGIIGGVIIAPFSEYAITDTAALNYLFQQTSPIR